MTRARDYEIINGEKVYTAHRDLNDFCEHCFEDIRRESSLQIRRHLHSLYGR